MIDQAIKFKDLFKIPTKNGLSKPSRVIGEGKKIIMMNEIFAQRRIRNANMKRAPVSETEIQSHGLKKGDLLFARTSLKFEGAGKCVIFEGDKETVVYESNLIRCRLDENKANTHFYFYYFNTYEGRKIIESILMETAATSMRGSDLSELRVPYFDISFQNIVAKILSSIEDKIELNQQMNETLEEIAKTLFKSWFIDFDPVRAKAEGRPTGLSKEISDLFPDSFEESELGEIPKGWKASQVKDFCSVIQKGIAPKYTENQSYPVINQKCIRNLEINFDLCRFTEYKKVMEDRYLENFDILLNSMGTGTLGRSALFVEHHTKAVVDGCISVMRGKSKNFSLYVYQSISRR